MSNKLFAFQFAIALCLVAHSIYTYSMCKKVTNWNMTNAIVIESTLTENTVSNGRFDSSNMRVYPKIKYSYEIDDIQHFGSCLSYGQLSIDDAGGCWNKFIKKYEKGSSIVIQVCPQDPTKSSILKIIPKNNYYYMIFSFLFLAFISSLFYLKGVKDLSKF